MSAFLVQVASVLTCKAFAKSQFLGPTFDLNRKSKKNLENDSKKWKRSNDGIGAPIRGVQELHQQKQGSFDNEGKQLW